MKKLFFFTYTKLKNKTYFFSGGFPAAFHWTDGLLPGSNQMFVRICLQCGFSGHQHGSGLTETLETWQYHTITLNKINFIHPPFPIIFGKILIKSHFCDKSMAESCSALKRNLYCPWNLQKRKSLFHQKKINCEFNFYK